jgi:hypothetical protein
MNILPELTMQGCCIVSGSFSLEKIVYSITLLSEQTKNSKEL